MIPYILIFIITLVFQAGATGSDHDSMVTIIASGETHAMIDACDCQISPGGGLAKRSHLLNSMGPRNQMLLLDAGGFAGGGIYDSYTEGRKGDSIRTKITISGMGKMEYDAVAIGDDDLQYGGKWLVAEAKAASLPLISANCFLDDNKTLADPYILVKKGAYTFGITAVTSPERLFAIDTSIKIKDPVHSLKKIWKEMCQRSDFQIILSHLGQDSAEVLNDSFPECDLIVNGHRKSDQQPIVMTTQAPVLQFGFEGKSLSYAIVKQDGKKMDIIKSGRHDISPAIPDDSLMVKFIKLPQTKLQRVYDLYIMSQCPYGLEALTGFVDFIKQFPEIEWSINFIGSIRNGSQLVSMHGDAEVQDELIWLAVKSLYPEKWYEFLAGRIKNNMPTDSTLSTMKLDKNKISAWVNHKGRLELSEHYLRSTRLDIKASPTLLVNNIPLEMNITKERLAKYQCSKEPASSKSCESLPECLDDRDCKKSGKIGQCVSGKCNYRDAVNFTFTVLVADSTEQDPETAIMETTKDLFEGATIELVKIGSKKGHELKKKYNPDALPFYLFGIDVKQAYNYSSIESGLIEKNGGLQFKKGLISNNYFYKRKLEQGKIVLFIDPFFAQLPKIINELQADTMLRNVVQILPAFYSDPSSVESGREERFRQDEALRWLVINQFFKEKYADYLLEYSKNPGSSFWIRECRKTGTDPDSLMSKSISNTELTKTLWSDLSALSIKEPVTLFFDNREIVPIRGELEFKKLLMKRFK